MKTRFTKFGVRFTWSTEESLLTFDMLWYGLWKAGNYLKIGNWSVFVLFRWRFVFGIIMAWKGREPFPSDAITTLENNKAASLLLQRFRK